MASCISLSESTARRPVHHPGEGFCCGFAAAGASEGCAAGDAGTCCVWFAHLGQCPAQRAAPCAPGTVTVCVRERSVRTRDDGPQSRASPARFVRPRPSIEAPCRLPAGTCVCRALREPRRIALWAYS